MPSNQILTVAQMRAAEQALIDGGETVASLMERAGTGAADWIWRMAAGRAVTVLCGPGNNGGDGYVIARVLQERGLTVAVIAPLDPATEAAKAARARWGGVPVASAHGTVLVDCLFGSGLTRPLSGELRAILLELAGTHDRRVAIDLPSGVESDSGRPLSDALPTYDLTVALGAWKPAHWLSQSIMGQMRLLDIGVGEVAGACVLAKRPSLAPPLPAAHKYARGLLAVVGGEMPGAAMLACRAALHGGAGYVKLMADRKTPAAPDEVVLDARPLGEALADERIGAVLVGPGLGRSAAARARLEAVLERDLPTVLDADALMLLRPAMLTSGRQGLVLTPHDGELAALCASFEVDAETRLARVEALARATGATVIAKGPATIVASPLTPARFMPSAPSWLSTAGTGDVLAGLVGSRMARPGTPGCATIEACWIHREAALLAGAAFSAGSLIDYIPDAYARFL